MSDIVFMFSGQGSQHYGMASYLFEHFCEFRNYMEELDSCVKNYLNESIIDKIYTKGKKFVDPFDELIYTNPAIFMVQYSLAKTLIEKGATPSYLMGASLGEFVAAAVADVFDAKEILIAISSIANTMETNCQTGSMLAILSSPDLYENESVIKNNSEIAGVNYNEHFVISATKDKLDKIIEFLRKQNINYLLLPVNCPFHSSLMEPAKKAYMSLLENLKPKKPKIPFISCAKASQIDEFLNKYFWEVIRKPIKFSDAISILEDKGDFIYMDLGPSGTMANFAKRNFLPESKSKSLAIFSLFENEKKGMEKAIEIIKKNNKSNKGVKKMKTYIFPGQGAQKRGMGEGLFEEFSDLTETADKILGYSIKELCLEDPNKKLNQTDFTQPALFVINAMLWLKKCKQTEQKPDFLAGHSMGEYSSLYAAGAFDFETGLKLLKERGRLMAMAEGGGMAAVIGMEEEKINQVIKDNNLTELSVANYNTADQIVISGLKQQVEDAKPIFEQNGARTYIVLRVSGAFHSKYMQDSRNQFEEFINQFEFKSLTIPVIANVTASEYENNDSKIKKNLCQQLTSPVKWSESIRYLMGKGDMVFEEIGPGKVLTKMQVKIEKMSPIIRDEKGIRSQKSEVRNQKEEGVRGKDKKSFEDEFAATELGNASFKKDYNLKYAYVAGAMGNGVSSTEFVIKMGKAGMLAFFGSGGLDINEVEDAIIEIKNNLNDKTFGVNFMHHPQDPDYEENLVDMLIKNQVTHIEAAAFMQMTQALVRYRLQGVSTASDGSIIMKNKIMAKLSRPEIAENFLRPAPEQLVKALLESDKITKEQADLANKIPMADAICAEADSGGHTDMAQAFALFPSINALKEKIVRQENYVNDIYANDIYLGLAGGIGTPQAAAAAFVLGADFILTGSINQCTVEARTSDVVKDMLSQMNVQDTDYAPSGDMFEFGSKVQVLKRGTFFPPRANKLYNLYTQFNSIDEIDQKTKEQLQKLYFKNDFDQVYEEIKDYYSQKDPTQIEKANANPKYKMTLIFKYYLNFTLKLAFFGVEDDKVNFQIYTGPALGAFNQWVKETELSDWRNRHVDEIAEKLLNATSEFLQERFKN